MIKGSSRTNAGLRLRRLWGQYGGTAAMALVVGVAALWSARCDTVAEISFDIRKFDGIDSSGVANVSACAGDDGRAKLRFVVLDQSGEVIRPNDQLEGVTVNASSFNAGSVSISSGRLYPVTAKELVRCAAPCQADRDCESQLGKICMEGFCVENPEQDPDAACLPAGLDVCRPYDAGSDELGNRYQLTGSNAVSFCRASCASDDECGGGSCVQDAGGNYCSLGLRGEFCSGNAECPPGFNCEAIEGDGDGRSFCTLDTTVRATGALEFASPQPVGANEQPIAVALVMDNSGSLFGRGVVEDDKTVRSTRATDPTEFRLAAARTFLLNLRRKQFAQNAVVSAWSFRGESDLGVTPLFGDIASIPPNPYTARFGQASPTQTPDQVAISDLSRAGDFGRSPVYEAVRVVSQNMIDLGVSGRRAPFIVLFTDGPDDTAIITEGGDEAQRDAALRSWRQRLDEAASVVQEAGARLFIVHLDTGLSADGVAALSPDPLNAAAYGRDSSGRVGPLEEYAQLACQTGGHYLYVTDPSTLTTTFDTLVDLIGGTWEVEVGVESLGQAALFNGAYRLGMDVEVRLDGRNDTYSHNPYGGSVFGGQLDANDTRGVVFRREGSQPPRLISAGPGAGAGEN
jgi:hypothetical protein